MNYWTQLSVELANQNNYLDLLFNVYPVIQNNTRNIDKNIWNNVEKYFIQKDNINLISELLKLDLFLQ